MHTTSQLPIVIHGTLMRDAIVSITSYGFGCIGVVNSKQQFLGVITDGDLRRHMADDFLDLKVEEIMTANPVTIGPKDLMMQALNIMETKKITGLFVTDPATNSPIGFLHIHDCLRLGIV